MGISHNPLNDVLILLACAVVALALFRRLHLPPILGYLSVGLVAGSHALGWVPDGAAIHLLAEIGIVFLLFMIGLEISLPHLIAMKGTVLGLGSAQVVITLLVTGALSLHFGVSWQGALILGGVIALSSTAITARQLVEQLEMQSAHGRVALGVLLFQDLAVVPFLVIIPILAEPAEHSITLPLFWALAKGTLAFAIMFAAGHWLLRPLFHTVARAHSIELFTLTILLVALAAAALTFELGLSLALGAFLAGMMLGETEYRHQIEAEVRPFRDVLMGLFFISVGAQLDLRILPDFWIWVLAVTLLLVVGKAIIIAVITRLGGYGLNVSFRSALVLAQGGEFGFALITLGVAEGLFPDQVTQPVLAGIVCSMFIAPLLIRHNERIASWICLSHKGGNLDQGQGLDELTDTFANHVIICGFGRIGQNLALFLKEEDFDYVALDLDPVLIREAWEAGEQVFFGDSSNGEVLKLAGIDKARALVVTFHDYHLTQRIVETARGTSPEIMIVARTQDDHHLEELEATGANDVVPESLEASMMLAAHTLRHLGVDREEINFLIDNARTDHYKRLRGVFQGEDLEDLVSEDDLHRLHTVVLGDGCHAIGKPISHLDLDGLGVEITALRRGGIHGETPSPELEMRPGDTLILQGPSHQLERAEELLLRGW